MIIGLVIATAVVVAIVVKSLSTHGRDLDFSAREQVAKMQSRHTS